MAMPDIPMYVFTGFLESGKTKFIQETLEDERFNTGERTLLLVFEEGEEEYDVSAYPHKEVYEQVLERRRRGYPAHRGHSRSGSTSRPPRLRHSPSRAG